MALAEEVYREILALQLSRLGEAQKELSAARTAAREREAAELAAFDIDMLRGELLLRGRRRQEGARLLREMGSRVRREQGPDAWSQALFRLEAIAAAAPAASDWTLAADAARLVVEHDPSCGGGHCAPALALDPAGDEKGAREAFAAARARWTKADADLPERKGLR